MGEKAKVHFNSVRITSPSSVPCGYLLESCLKEAEDRVIQVDWDYPGLARLFGWLPCHSSTDGTIDCPVCGRTAGEMIEEAREVIDEHLGEWVRDPGYF